MLPNVRICRSQTETRKTSNGAEAGPLLASITARLNDTTWVESSHFLCGDLDLRAVADRPPPEWSALIVNALLAPLTLPFEGGAKRNRKAAMAEKPFLARAVGSRGCCGGGRC